MTDTYTYDVFGATKSHTGASANAWKCNCDLAAQNIATNCIAP